MRALLDRSFFCLCKGAAVMLLAVAPLIWGASPLYAGASVSSGYQVTAVRVFMAMDDNKDGFITPDEMRGHHKEFFAGLDRNGDGFISLREAQFKKRSIARFHELNTDQDSRLSFEESLTVESQRFAAADHDKDGRVTYEEFMAHAKLMSASSPSRAR